MDNPVEMNKSASRPQRFQVLDSFRGVSALLVALFHFHAFGHFYELNFIRNAYLFVDFFFVLSGFVIAHGYSARIAENAGEVLRFVCRRLGRVYPLHVSLLLIFLGLETVKFVLVPMLGVGVEENAFSGSHSVDSFFTQLFFLHSFGLHDGLTWNGPSWSVAVEFWVYILFAFMWLFFFQYRAYITAFLMVAGLVALWAFPGSMSATVDYGFLRCVHGFFLGVTLYFVRTNIGDIYIKWPTLLEILLVAAVILYVSIYGRGYSSLGAGLVFGVVVFVFSYEKGLVSRFLSLAPFAFLGVISYSIYMVHSLVLTVWGRAMTLVESVTGYQLYFQASHFIPGGGERWLFYFGEQWVSDLLAVVYIIVLTLVSAFTYRFVEHRFRYVFGGK